MKNSIVSLDTLLDWKRRIDQNASLSIVTDQQTGISYAVKSVSEMKTGFLNELRNGNIFSPGQDIELGVCTIKDSKLQSGKNQLVYALRISSQTTADQAKATLLAATFNGTAPANLLNGTVTINQNAELIRLTGSDVCNTKASTGNEDDFRQVVPFQLRPETTFSPILELGYAAAANQAYKFEWRAIEFVEISKA